MHVGSCFTFCLQVSNAKYSCCDLFSLKRGSAKPTSLSSYIGSRHSDIMQNTTFYCGILLAVLFGLGVIYEIARHIRGIVFFYIEDASLLVFLGSLVILYHIRSLIS